MKNQKQNRIIQKKHLYKGNLTLICEFIIGFKWNKEDYYQKDSE